MEAIGEGCCALRTHQIGGDIEDCSDDADDLSAGDVGRCPTDGCLQPEPGTGDERGGHLERGRDEGNNHNEVAVVDDGTLPIDYEAKETQVAEFDGENAEPNQCAKGKNVSLRLGDFPQHFVDRDFLREFERFIFSKVDCCGQAKEMRSSELEEDSRRDQA